MAMPVIVQKEVRDPSATTAANAANIVIEQVDLIGSFRRLYDFDNEQLCTFYNHSANIQSGGGLSCRFYDELPARVQKRYDDICQKMSKRKEACPQPTPRTSAPVAPPVGVPGVYSPSATVDSPPPTGDEEEMEGTESSDTTPAIGNGLPPKFNLLGRGRSYSVDELRSAKP